MNNISGCWQNAHPVRIVKLFEGGGSRMKKDREIQKKTDGREKTVKMAAAGLFAAMIAIMTAYICHIPYGANGGYIHFGDALIYLAAVFLPKPYALAAAAIGGGVADLLTAPMWAPATVIIKMLIVLPFSEKQEKVLTPRNWTAPFAAAALSAAGYYLAEGILFGSFITPAASLAGSLIQSGGSAVFFFALGAAFDRARVKGKIQRIMHLDSRA